VVTKRSQREPATIDVLERGEVAFLATPRVRPRDLLPLNDLPPHPREVQRLYLLLSPQGKPLYRRILVGKNRLPEGHRQRFWACVDRVGSSIEDVVGDLGESEYQTKTRGPRRQPPARALAEGSYALVRHGDHAHFTYEVDDPSAPAEVLRALRIEPHASYVVVAFNPSAPPRLGAPDRRLDEDAPDWVLAKFGKKRFAPLDLDLFDAQGLEIVLMGGRHEVSAELRAGAAAEGSLDSP
jgi:hypothetical protein